MKLENVMAVALAAGFFSFVAVSLILRLTRQVVVIKPDKRMNGFGFLGIALVILPMAAIEELLFRWLAIGQLGRLIGLVPAFLVSMILFAFAHRGNGRMNFGAIFNLLVVSAVLGMVYLNWGVWVAAAAHAGWNLAEWGLGYNVSGEKNRRFLPAPIHREVKGEPFGPEAHWSASLVLLTVMLVLLDLAHVHF